MICGDQGIFKQKCRADEPFGYAQDRLRVIRRMRIPFGGRRCAFPPYNRQLATLNPNCSAGSNPSQPPPFDKLRTGLSGEEPASLYLWQGEPEGFRSWMYSIFCSRLCRAPAGLLGTG